jgi:ABC-type transport system involved in cytochrome c biogenesis permease subunit
MHLKIDSHFSLLPAHILLKSCKDDEVFSVSIIDVCGLTALGIPAAPWSEAEWGARHPYGRP